VNLEESRVILKEVQVRHDEIIVLAKSIVELQSMFEETSDLVARQDDLINQIAFQMSNAQAYTGQATEELGQAVISAKKVRARKWCLASACIVLIVVLVLVIIFVVVPKVKAMTQ
jgi:t-SNARE complex subunit (syntaxin)